MTKITYSRTFALVWRIIISALVIFGLILNFALSNGVNDAARLLAYFTIQSNIFVAALFVFLAVKTALQLHKEGKYGEAESVSPLIQLGVTFIITITFVVYATLLSEINFEIQESAMQASLRALGNILVHYVVPIMTIIDWIFFMPHGKLKFKAAAWWLLYPVVYVIFILIRAFVGGPLYVSTDGTEVFYPYPFANPDIVGWGNMAWILPILFLGFFGLGCGYVVLDKLFRKLFADKTRPPVKTNATTEQQN
jgi:hypothetical protein